LGYSVEDLRISGDGSKVFCMEWDSFMPGIYGQERLWAKYPCLIVFVDTFLTIDSSKVWVNFPNHGIEGWDFGVPDSSSIKHYREPPNRPHLDFIGGIRK
jgi:hypothetical protein